MRRPPTSTARFADQPLSLVPPEQVLDRVEALHRTIAARAFEIFRNRGGGEGHAGEDWLRAEAELFHPAHLDASEIGDIVLVYAEVAGFCSSDLKVCVEPRRLTIMAERKNHFHSVGKPIYCESCSDHIFRVLQLPVEVDARAAHATVNNGVLEIVLPKAAAVSKFQSASKADWLVRAVDFAPWSQTRWGSAADARQP